MKSIWHLKLGIIIIIFENFDLSCQYKAVQSTLSCFIIARWFSCTVKWNAKTNFIIIWRITFHVEPTAPVMSRGTNVHAYLYQGITNFNDFNEIALGRGSCLYNSNLKYIHFNEKFLKTQRFYLQIWFYIFNKVPKNPENAVHLVAVMFFIGGWGTSADP